MCPLSQRQLNQLATLNLVNLILLDPPRVGKSALSVWLGLEAIQRAYQFFTLPWTS